MHAFEGVEAQDLAVEFVGQDQAAELGDLHGVVRGARRFVGDAEQGEGRAALGFPDAFHGSDLGGLVLQGVQAVQVADQELQRDHCCGGENRGPHGFVGALRGTALEQLPGAQARDEKRSGERRCQQFVAEPVGEGRVEDHGPPVGGDELTVDDFIAGGCVHPGVQTQDPECRQRGAQGHQEGGDQVDTLAHPPAPEQHDAQEAGLQEERRQHFIAQQGPRDVARAFHEARPVGAELEAHDDARDHAQCKGQGKDLGPEIVGLFPGQVARLHKPQAEEQQKPAHGDGDGGKEDVKADVRAELHAREDEGVEFHGGLLRRLMIRRRWVCRVRAVLRRWWEPEPRGGALDR